MGDHNVGARTEFAMTEELMSHGVRRDLRQLNAWVRTRSALLAEPMRDFLALFGFQVLLNVLVVAQERAASTVAVGPSFVSNVLLASVSYVAVRKMVQGGSPALGVGYALGGGVGALVGLHAARVLGL